MKHAIYGIAKITPEIIFIVDLNGPMSITNDAEYVVEQLTKRVNNTRIVYKDSMGCWDELLHDNGTFTGFGTYHGPLPPQSRIVADKL